MNEASKPRREIIVGHANTWHDPAIAVAEGDSLFAEGIERHAQCKRALDMPRLWYSWRALRDALARSGPWPVRDARVVALTSWSGEVPMAPLSNPARSPIPALLAASRALEPLFVQQLRWVLRGYPPRPFAAPDAPGPGVPGAEGTVVETKGVEHQIAHAANAVYTSPFDECVVLVIDGYGEGTAVSAYHFRDNRFRLLHQCRPEVSLGLLYAAVTQFCGFDPYQGEEWKVMGLAAYGRHRSELYDFFRERIEVRGLDVAFRPVGGAPYAFDRSAWAELERRAGGFRRPGDEDVLRAADLAHNFQKCFEEVLVELARGASALGLSKNLCFSGGCALNSAANGRLVAESGFERLHVPSAPGDDGNALGVVLYEKYHERGAPRRPAVLPPYLGTALDPDRARAVLDRGGVAYRTIADERALCAEVATLLAEGKIVGWMQGRAEFGPRALGNRSILADPRDAAMKDRINRTVKFREFYRPLAPAVLDEEGAAYFEDYQSSPYMERTLRFRPEAAARVPAVVHRDGTGRLQSVRREWSPLFYDLVAAFAERTGEPVLLNTSFNVMGKPIVHGVEDALAVLYTTGLDCLVVGPHLVSK